MKGLRNRAMSLGLCIALVGAVSTWQAEASSPAHDFNLCGENDLPETGLQGDVPRVDQESGRAEQGYNCGLALVGHATLGADGRSAAGNANMAWAGHCAYVSGSGALFGRGTPQPWQGVAVVDVSDPASPQHVRTLRTPGSQLTSETLHAVETPDRAILVTGEYGNQSGGDKPMDIYDVSDCANPRLITTYLWPENIHNLTISGSGRYVFATQPLQVLDIADPAHPVYVGNLENVTPYPLVGTGPYPDLDDPDVVPKKNGGYTSHEAWPTFDGTKLYLGGQLPTFEVFTILDITAWLADPVNAKPRVISQREGRGHSVRTGNAGGTPFILHSEESVFGMAKGCISEELNPVAGPAQPWLTDISDEADPKRLSQFTLEINDPLNCPAQIDSGVDTSVHYHDVDDAADTTFAMLSMWNAGLRIADVRDPAHPTEVAYFNPGDVASGDTVNLDQAWGHVRYVPETGHIWFATASGGFWVVELEPQVREHLGLDDGKGKKGKKPKPRDPDGRAGRMGVTTSSSDAYVVDVTPMYCTLGTAAAAAGSAAPR